MDILTEIGSEIANLAQNVAPATYSFLMRANIAFGLPAIGVYLGFRQGGWRSTELNRLLLIVGCAVGISIPLGNLDYYSPLRPWITLFFMVNLSMLPKIWSFLLAEKRLHQRRVHRWLISGLTVLFIVNLFRS